MTDSKGESLGIFGVSEIEGIAVMVTWFYFLVFILSLTLALKCLIQNKNIDTLFVLFFATIIINCMGRYFLAASDRLEMAL